MEYCKWKDTEYNERKLEKVKKSRKQKVEMEVSDDGRPPKKKCLKDIHEEKTSRRKKTFDSKKG